MSIEGIALEHFISVPQTDLNSTVPSCQRYSVFYSFLYYDIKQDSATTTAHITHFILFLKDKKY